MRGDLQFRSETGQSDKPSYPWKGQQDNPVGGQLHLGSWNVYNSIVKIHSQFYLLCPLDFRANRVYIVPQRARRLVSLQCVSTDHSSVSHFEHVLIYFWQKVRVPLFAGSTWRPSLVTLSAAPVGTSENCMALLVSNSNNSIWLFDWIIRVRAFSF